MPDPFDALRTPLVPTDPDPGFSRRLRAQLLHALELPKGVTTTNLAHSDLSAETTTAPPGPSEHQATGTGAAADAGGGIVPYLIVADGRRALSWYERAFGPRRRGEPFVMDDGRVGHAELELAGSLVFLADESPESKVAAPRPGAEATVSLAAQVGDVDRAVARAVAEGAELERPPVTHPYGRNAVVRDPFGHRWILSTPPVAPDDRRAPGPGIRHGDVGYVSLWVPDADRAAAFYSSVLGWTFGPAAAGGNRQVEGTSISHGLAGGRGPTLFVCYAVDDLDAAIERVRAAGGRADEPTEEPYGRIAMCVDPESMAFALYRPPPGERERRPALNGEHHGDVSYLTMEVVDSAVARRFYGAVLDWQFVPGRVDDGWGPTDVTPMTGLHGGHRSPTVVPMYRVDDIEAAVGRVRAAGGSATDPERHDYGWSSDCVDDQGTRFYLGQH